MIDLILNQNPWWRDRALISHDPKLRELEHQRFSFRPGVLDELNLSQPGIYTLRGPRQVGKTTAVKLLIRQLLADKEIAKELVMYYSCDNLDIRQELIELLEAYFSHLRTLGLSERRAFILIDEITAITDWQRAIKYLVDLGRLENCFMVLTGSNAADLRRGMERLPGRRGEIATPDKVLLPLTFREYASLVAPELAAGFGKGQAIASLAYVDIAQLHSMLPSLRELSALFDRYLVTGGYLAAINDYFKDGEIGYATYERYQHWLRGDIAKAGKNERTARQIIRELLRISVSAFGWETIAKKIDIATHKTVSEYMETMEDAFVLKTLYQVDLNTGSPRIKKLKKSYFLDPFIQWTMRGWVENWLTYPDQVAAGLLTGELKPRLVEQVVANELFSRFDRRDWLASNVFFWKNNAEVDFIVSQEDELLPVEVKYQQGAALANCAAMRRLGFRKGLLISRDTLATAEGFVVLPVELFLMLGDGGLKA